MKTSYTPDQKIKLKKALATVGYSIIYFAGVNAGWIYPIGSSPLATIGKHSFDIDSIITVDRANHSFTIA